MQPTQVASDTNYWSLYETVVPCLQNRLFMTGPGPLVAVIVAYLVTIFYAAPKFMENRKAYQLRGLVLTYDALQIGLNLALLIYGYGGMCLDGDYLFTCLRSTPHTAYITYLYFLLKIFDMVETVMFVLRKKYSQVSVLHVYHHVVIAAGSHISLLIEPGGHSAFLGFQNLIVHAIMYVYYFVAAYDPVNIRKYSHYKIRLTQVQITQFIFNMIHFSLPLLVPGCGYSKFVSAMVLSTNSLLMALFVNFYVRAYGWRL